MSSQEYSQPLKSYRAKPWDSPAGPIWSRLKPIMAEQEVKEPQPLIQEDSKWKPDADRPGMWTTMDSFLYSLTQLHLHVQQAPAEWHNGEQSERRVKTPLDREVIEEQIRWVNLKYRAL